MRLWIVLLCCQSTVPVTSFFVSQTYLESLHQLSVVQPPVTVSIVSTPTDIQELADLRYDEWCSGGDDPSIRNCSRQAFRRATADIFAERQQDGMTTITVLALWDGCGKAVGAGEASTAELVGVVTENTTDRFRYVTDVVTAQPFRRRGVARSLLAALEQSSPGCTMLLHVVDTNKAALAFYRNIGYSEATDTNMPKGLHAERLAENAGAQGQVLLWKNTAG